MLKQKNYLIKFNNVSKIYKNGKGIYDLNIELPKNKIIGLIGNNGSGKTTTIKTLLGEFKLKNGNIDLNFNTEGNQVKEVSFLPDQNNYPKNFNIVDYAVYTANLKFIDKNLISERIEKWIKILKLNDWRKSSFKELSTGLQKKALLLSVLICDPKLIILDEPTANLDPDARLDFLDIIKKLHKELNIDIIITSHILDELENVIDYIVILNDGKIKYNSEFSKKDKNLSALYKEHVKNSEKINLSEIKLDGVKNV